MPGKFTKGRFHLHLALAALLLVMLVGCAVTPVTARGAGSEQLKEGDRHFNEHSYKPAAEIFEQALKAGLNGEEKARVLRDLATCRFKLEEYGKSADALTTLAESFSGTLWEARARWDLGWLYFRRPHNYYRTEDEISWGRWLENGEYVSVHQEDRTGAYTELAKAVELYEQIVARKIRVDDRAKAIGEAVDCLQDFNKLLETEWTESYRQWYYQVNQGREEKDYVRVVPAVEYVPALEIDLSDLYGRERAQRSLLVKELIKHNYKRVIEIDKKNLAGEAASANAAWRRGAFLARWYGKFSGDYRHLSSRYPPEPLSSAEERFETYAPGEDPVAALEAALKFKSDEVHEKVRYSLATIAQWDNDYVKALELFQEFRRLYPKSDWVENAKAAEAQMLKKELFLQTRLAGFNSGVEPELNITTRNLDKLKVSAWVVDLEELVFNDLPGDGRRYGFAHLLQQRYGKVKEGFAGAEKVAEFEVDIDDKGDHQNVGAGFNLPIKKKGAYVVLMGPEGDEYGMLVNITDAVLSSRIHKNGALMFLTDSATGEPLKGGELTLLNRYSTQRSHNLIDTATGRTDRDGLYVYDFPRPGAEIYNAAVEGLARVDGGWAILADNYHYGYRTQENRLKAYTYTDRPVYRPGQTVFFRSLLRAFADDALHNAPDVKLKLTIRDPRGQEVYTGEHMTNEFGSISGELTLKDDAALGWYNIQLEQLSGWKFLSRRNQWVEQASGAGFRVEEYKKPEYEVTVSPETDDARTGDKVKARIEAKYFFGAPVTEAKVKYRVMRNRWWYYHYRGGRYSWFYGSGYEGWNRPWYGGGQEFVTEGEGELDENGALVIEFDTSLPDMTIPPDQWPDYTYTISAEVTDASRRVIEGSGSIRVTRTEFFASLSSERHLFRPEDNVEIGLNVKTANDQPKAVEGKVEVYKITWSGLNNEDRHEELIDTLEAATDKSGRAFIKYKAKKSGYLTFRFVTLDSREQEVRAEHGLWVVDENYHGLDYRFSGLEIVTDKRTYEQGETAHVMIAARRPDATVLVTQQADNELLDYEVLRLQGNSKLIDVKMAAEHVPNFFISGVSVQDGEAHSVAQELFVPPTDRFIDVAIEPDKDEYLAASEGRFKVKATDEDGNPVDAEISLSVLDKSLYYIQPDMAPDIRQYFHAARRYNGVTLGCSALFQGPGTWLRQLNANVNYRQAPPPQEWGGYWQMGEEEYKLGARGRTSMARNGAGDEGMVAMYDSAGVAEPMAAPSEAPAATMEMEEMAFGADKDDGMMLAKAKKAEGGGGGAPEPVFAEAQLRSEFADSAFWTPAVRTGSDGEATVTVKFPDNLTTWQVVGRGADRGTRVGNSTASVVTTKNLVLRMQAPRFFMERDEVVLSAVVHNYLEGEAKVRVSIKEKNNLLIISGENPVDITVPAGGEMRVDWRADVVGEGTAEITMQALSQEESDAVQMEFPVLVHGMEKFIAENGFLKKNNLAELTLTIPAERREGSTELTVTLSPSLAASMLDAIPYLIDYPYGCMEQTMSRFLPSVVTMKTMQEMGIDFDEVRKQFDKGDASRLAEHMYRRKSHPVFSQSILNDVIDKGLRRIYDAQHSNGAWGWWKESRDDTYMTAYVAYGLAVAKASDRAVDDNRLKRAYEWLKKELPSKRNSRQVQLYICYSLSHSPYGGQDEWKKTLNELWDLRDMFNSYEDALMAITMHNIGDEERAKIMLRNMEDRLKVDTSNDTAWFDTGSRWWWWYNDRIETNAFALKAYALIQPENVHCTQLMNWLIRNRRNNHWRSTKDTANVLYAMADYIRANKELDVDYTLRVNVNGQQVKNVRVTTDNMFTFDSVLKLDDSRLPAGDLKISIEKEGRGNLYWSAWLEYFTLEENITPAGNEIFVEREYYKLTQKPGTVGQRLEYDRETLKDGDMLKSGDLIEVVLKVEAKNDYEYLIFEDMKGAGFEPVELRSGSDWSGFYSYKELRDTKVVFFADRMNQGKHQLNYRMRAEIPGKFHVLPTKAWAMYSEDVRANSAEIILAIED